MVLDKGVQLLHCALASGGPGGSRLYLEFLSDLVIDRIALVFYSGRPGVVLGRWQAILLIKVPCATDWFVTLHQDIESNALFAIKVFHQKNLLL